MRFWTHRKVQGFYGFEEKKPAFFLRPCMVSKKTDFFSEFFHVGTLSGFGPVFRLFLDKILVVCERYLALLCMWERQGKTDGLKNQSPFFAPSPSLVEIPLNALQDTHETISFPVNITQLYRPLYCSICGIYEDKTCVVMISVACRVFLHSMLLGVLCAEK